MRKTCEFRSDAGKEDSRPGALSIPQFCEEYSVGKTFVFEQIKLGKLLARKAGHRTLIFRQDAETWAASLPLAGAA